MIPSIGRIVHYKLQQHDIESIRQQRFDGQNNFGDRGNPVEVGDVFPAMITRVWDPEPTEESVVQLQVFLDGNDQIWASSAHQGEENGQWREPKRA